MKYKLFATCILVKGLMRALICDLQRQKFHFIPTTLYEILSNDCVDFEELSSKLTANEKKIVQEYKYFLIENEYIFTDSNLELFPKLDLSWDIPYPIHNAILEIDENNDIDYTSSITQLEKLGTQFIELRIFNIITKLFFIKVISAFKFTNIRSIVIIINNQHFIDESFWKKILTDEKRISNIFIYNDLKNNGRISIVETTSNVIYIDKNDLSALHCGKVAPKYFSMLTPHYTEAQQHNTCLNRKISIDANGEIKNCPSMAKSYGNIKDITLKEALETNGFKDVWYINKDKINICKNCEFRYICTDCRAYIENPEDIYSKPLKCGYNPDTCEWEEWSQNPLKQKAIEHYGMQELVVKKNS